MELILQEFPDFGSQWDRHLESWNPIITRPIALDLAEFADFAVDTIQTADDLEIERLAATIECLLIDGDAMINYAVRTMFLERIANRSKMSGVSLTRFTQKLQPLTYYCWQALDLRWEIDLSIPH